MDDARKFADLLDRLLAGVQVVRGTDGQASIGVDAAVPDLIDAHPALLSLETNAELARRLAAVTDEAAQQCLLAARQVLQACRQAGSTEPLRDTAKSEEQAAVPDEADPTNGGIKAALSVLGTLSRVGEKFADGGVLRAALAVVRGVSLASLMDNDAADTEAIRSAMLSELDEGLPLLWSLQPSPELAAICNQAGIAWAERQTGDRSENLERAIACFRAALEVRNKEGTPRDWAATQNNLGIAFGNRLRGDRGDNQESSIECFQAALEVYSKNGTPHDWATTQNNLGAAYGDRLRGDRGDNLERAIACFRAALEVHSKDGTPHDWAGTQTNLGNVYRNRLRGDRGSNLERAIACCQAALEVYTQGGAPNDWATTQNNLGAAHGDRLRGDRGDNLERAIECLQAALKVRSKDGTPHDWATTQNNLGNAYRDRLRGDRGENLERAIECFQAALEIYSKDGTPYQWAGTQNNLGAAYNNRLRGDRGESQERAIACYRAALEVYTQDGMPHDWAGTQNNLGVAYNERLRGNRSENQEHAIACYQAALEVYSKNGTSHDWAMTQNNLGNAYGDRLRGDRGDNLERAIECYQAALEVYSKDGTPLDWAMTQNNMGNAHDLRPGGDRGDNLERAIECFRAALEVHSKDDTPHDWAGTQTNLGNAYGDCLRGDRGENLERAIACWLAALPLLRLSMPPQALAALVSVGSAHRERGRLENDAHGALAHLHDARAAWREALALREALLAADAIAETRGEAARRSRNLVSLLALLETELGDPHAAVATLERGRAIALRATLSLAWLETLSDNQRAPVDQASEVLGDLRRNLPSVADARHPGAVRAWEQAVAEAQAALSAELAAVEMAAGFSPPQSLDAAALAALAPPGWAVVLLATTPDGGMAFLLPHAPPGTPPMIKHVSLPQATSPALRDLLITWNTAYRALLVAMRQARSIDRALLLPANAVLVTMLDTLWRDVMGPVLAALPAIGLGPGAPLVLLPQGDLALMPLHAAGPAGTGRCVLDDHEVRYAPSGYALQTATERLERRKAMRETDAAGTERPLIDAAGRGHDLSGAFNPMKDTKDELPRAEDTEMPALRILFTRALGQQARCHVGPAATVEQVLADAPLSGYLHLACHGSFDMADPATSGLQLAGDRRLTLPTIVRDLRLDRCRLVSLSACETGMVDVQHLPDEFVGLTAAFLMAGAPGVVATFWTVLDQPTAAVLTRFYDLHLLGQGMPPATALRQAVLDLRKTARAPATDLRAAALARHSRPFDEPEDAPPAPSQDLPPDPQHVLDLPIVWAAYATHGV